MDRYFTLNNSVAPFTLFSIEHLFAIGVLLVIYIMLYLKSGRLEEPRFDRLARYFLATALILQEISLNVWRMYEGVWSVADSLPLHLCGIMVLTCPIMLVTKSYKIYEIAYFLGLGGASQAVLTPDIGVYGFPHYRFYQFFVSHGLIILSILYMTFVCKYRPNFRSFLKSFAFLNMMLPIVGILNYITGGNYFFIARKPETASIIDFLGPWPWYILALEAIGFILLLIPYLPIAAAGLYKNNSRKDLNM
jgi:hypothetical integral membrane protein (TIGR02206 family)